MKIIVFRDFNLFKWKCEKKLIHSPVKKKIKKILRKAKNNDKKNKL